MSNKNSLEHHAEFSQGILWNTAAISGKQTKQHAVLVPVHAAKVPWPLAEHSRFDNYSGTFFTPSLPADEPSIARPVQTAKVTFCHQSD